jgi:hypothetical protein
MSLRSSLLIVCFFLFLIGQRVLAAPGGCSCADFKLATTFEATVSNATPVSAYAVADFNGDGKLDIAETDFFGDSVVVLLNDGSGGMVVSKPYHLEVQPSAVVAADFNGDGRPDLAVTFTQNNNVSVLLNTGGGVFGSANYFGVGTGPQSISVGDFNGDAKPDLAIASGGQNGNGGVSVLLGDGSGSFSLASGSPIILGIQASELAIADFNSDGKRDLAVESFSNGAVLLIGDGTGRFAAPVKISDRSGGSIATADLNGDGKSDVALGTLFGLVIHLGDGTGGFGAPLITPHESGATIAAVFIADIDGDGKLDVAASASPPGGVTFFKGDGTGAVTTTPNYLTGKTLFEIAPGDFDGDGDLDIVGGESILFNIGAGVFDASRSVYTLIPALGVSGTTAFPSDLVLGDFNGDGRTDMAVAHSGAGRIAVFLRDASNNLTLSSAITYVNGNTLGALASADFNKDGRADLAVTMSVSTPFSFVSQLVLAMVTAPLLATSVKSDPSPPTSH